MPVKYYAFSAPTTTTGPIQILKDKDPKNPIFNFDSDFFNNLQSVSTLELAQSTPYVSLHTVDLNGEIIDDLNVNFFHKTVDMEKLHAGRFADRPAMSLNSVELKTTLASGYLYYTDVTLSLKIHSPYALTETTAMSLTLPGMPHRLQYGWNSPNEWLNKDKSSLLFQVVTYSLSVDETGQIELTVRGKALNETFNNILCGDDGSEIKSDTISNEEAGGINAKKAQIEAYAKYLQSAKKSTGKGVNDFSLVKKIAESYKNNENIARGPILKNFNKGLDDLSKKAAKNKGIVSLHDVVYSLCNKTFDKMQEMLPSVTEFRFIYGDINKTISGASIPPSLADFPINLKRFKGEIRSLVETGILVPTIQRLLNLLANSFVGNEEVWKNKLDNRSAGTYNAPEIVINFSNRGDAATGEVMEVTFHDAKYGIPATTTKQPDGPASLENIKQAIVAASEYTLPILQIGHAKSFVKGLTMDQVTSPSMKAVLIERMYKNRQATARSTKVASQNLQATPVKPITLPLRGGITVIGHSEWKVFRSLYLEMGIFLVDGVYKTMEVTHTLEPGKYDTDLVLWYN